MAQIVSVRLSRADASPWGFRLQGGKDFCQPLLIQKVNGGSLAEKAGLQVGDALIKVNNTEVFSLRHKEAQDALVKAGNSFELTVQRGGGATWKPQVTSVGSLPSPGSGVSPQTVTKTSLAQPPRQATPIASGHNVSPRPFAGSPQVNGGDQVKAIVNKQYNTPVGMYSEETIAETLSAQAEVLAGGVLGVNFKKNERTYDSQKSEVYKMVHEVELEPRDQEPAPMSSTKYFSTISHAVGGRATSPRPLTPLAQKMGVPSCPMDLPRELPQQPLPQQQAKPQQPQPPQQQPQPQQQQPPPQQPQPQEPKVDLSQECPSLPPSGPAATSQENPQCTDCGRSIVGVFVRIKDKNLHVECFKCATCGTSLKNVGYYSINCKLYCDIHAKMVARQNPPAPNMDPITIPPGGRIPSGALPSSGLNLGSPAPQSPQPGTLGPLPFHTPTSAGPKPFSSPAPVQSQIYAPVNIPPPAPASVPTKPPTQPPAPAPIGGGAPKGGSVAGATAPRRGRGVLNHVAPGGRIPVCGHCNNQIRGPFITALGKIWCPDHFLCVNAKCKRPLQDIGFVEESEGLYCEYCFEQYLAPDCTKCNNKIKGDCLNAIGKQFHPECFCCAYCGKLFGNNPFFLEDALPYCEADWNELFTTKCFSCGFPIEAGDRWVEALNNNYHSQCFNCTMCKKNLEGQSFFAKGGRPFCKNHAR